MNKIYEQKQLLLTKDKMDKETFKAIKGYNREELNNYMYNVYATGLKDAFEAMAEQQIFSRKEFEEVLSKRINDIKGIGKERKKAILDVITIIFEELNEITIHTELIEAEGGEDARS